MLHRDRVKARIVRMDRKGRPEGRVIEILDRKKAPIIGRLLHESGIWLLAPASFFFFGAQSTLPAQGARKDSKGPAGKPDRGRGT